LAFRLGRKVRGFPIFARISAKPLYAMGIKKLINQLS